MIGNALAAVAAGLALGMPLEELREGVERFSPAAGRMQVRRGAHFTVLDDTYNANPTSVMAAIDVLERAPGRRVCVLGDMLELGAQTEEFHEVVGMYAALHGVGPDRVRRHECGAGLPRRACARPAARTLF